MYMNTHVCTYLPGTNQGSLGSLTAFTSPCTSQPSFPPSHLIFSGCCSYYSSFFLPLLYLKSHVTASAIHGPLAYDSLKIITAVVQEQKDEYTGLNNKVACRPDVSEIVFQAIAALQLKISHSVSL